MGNSIQKKLDELKRLEDSATKGPWYVVEKPWLNDGDPTWVIAGSIDPHVATPICQPLEVLEWEEGEEPTYTQQDADMAFIAAARNHLLGLIQALEVVVSQCDKYQKVLEEMVGDCRGCHYCAADITAAQALGWMTEDCKWTDKAPEALRSKKS